MRPNRISLLTRHLSDVLDLPFIPCRASTCPSGATPVGIVGVDHEEDSSPDLQRHLQADPAERLQAESPRPHADQRRSNSAAMSLTGQTDPFCVPRAWEQNLNPAPGRRYVSSEGYESKMLELRRQ